MSPTKPATGAHEYGLTIARPLPDYIINMPTPVHLDREHVHDSIIPPEIQASHPRQWYPELSVSVDVFPSTAISVTPRCKQLKSSQALTSQAKHLSISMEA